METTGVHHRFLNLYLRQDWIERLGQKVLKVIKTNTDFETYWTSKDKKSKTFFFFCFLFFVLFFFFFGEGNQLKRKGNKKKGFRMCREF